MPTGIQFGDGIGKWEQEYSYNIFYSYAFTITYYGKYSSSPSYFYKFVPYIKINNDKINIDTNVPSAYSLEKYYLVYKFYEKRLSAYTEFSDLNSKFYPTNITGIYAGQTLISEHEYNDLEWNTNDYAIDSSTNYGYTNIAISKPNIDMIINPMDETLSAELTYSFNELNSITDNISFGKVRYNTTNNTWEENRELMYKPMLYKTIKFMYDNLIKGSAQNTYGAPIQGLYGCPSELGNTSVDSLLNGTGICCLSSENISLVTESFNINTNKSYNINIANCLKYSDTFLNIPIITDETFTDQFKLYYDDKIQNVSSLYSFFGIDEDIHMYNLSYLKTKLDEKILDGVKIYWETKIPKGNNIILFNYDKEHNTSLASGFLYDTLEYIGKTNYSNQTFSSNPYNISTPSTTFNTVPGINPPVEPLPAGGFTVSLRTVPKYSIINYNTTPPVSADYINSLCIQLSGNSTDKTAITGLLSAAYVRINYYCDRLQDILISSNHDSYTTYNKSKLYTYKDLSSISNTNVLASALLQYEYGNPCVKPGESIMASNLIQQSLAVLNKYNWINFTSLNSLTLNSLSGVNYNELPNDTFTKNWIKNNFDLSDLRI